MAARKKTNISRWDYIRLREELLARPARVFQCFKTAGVDCLDQLQIYHDLKKNDPITARRLEDEARSHGIPIHLEKGSKA